MTASRVIGYWLLVIGAAAVSQAQPPPVSGTVPIRNGKLQNDLDANGKHIINLNTDNLGLPVGSGLIPGLTILGNNVGNSGTTGPVLSLNPAQIKAMLTLGESDIAGLVTDLAGKQASLPIPATNGFLLGRNTDGTFLYRDPATLGGGTGGSGSVTNVTVGNLSPFFTSSVGTPGSTPNITFTLSSAPAVSWWGNAAGSSGAPGYNTSPFPAALMPAFTGDISTSAGSTVTTLGANKVGNSQLALMPAKTLKGNAGTGAGSAADLTAAQVKPLLAITESDVANLSVDLFAKESILSFGAPIGRTGNTISIPAATDFASGHLTAVDHALFRAKEAPSSEATVGDANGTWPTGATELTQAQALTAQRTETLPPANAYTSGRYIYYNDAVTTANFGRAFIPGGSDTLNGLPASSYLGALTPAFISGASAGGGKASMAIFKSDGASGWQRVQTKLSAAAFEDPLDANKNVRVDLSGQTPFAGNIFTPATAGNSVSVVPGITSGPEVMKGIGTNGAEAYSLIRQADIVPTEFILDASTPVVTNDGSIDTVKLNAQLVATTTFTWPDAANYASGERVYFYNIPGSVSQSTYAHIVGVNNNTFNGNTAIDFPADFNRFFTADPISGNWNVSGSSAAGGGLSKGAWSVLPIVSNVATLSVNPAYIQQNNSVTLPAATTLNITGAQTGDSGQLKVRQDATGGRTLALPAGSKTEVAQNGGAAGALTLTAGANAEDEFMWDFDGTNYNFYRGGLNFTQAAGSSYTVVADQGGPTTNANTAQGAANNSQYLGGSFVACGTSSTCLAAGTAYTIGKIDLTAAKVGTPTYNGYVSIWSDNGVAAPNDRPLAQVGSESSPGIVVSTYGTSNATITFNGINASVTAGTKYWIVYRGNQPTRTVSDLVTGPYRTSSNGVFNGTTTLTSSTASFTSADVGSTVTTAAAGVTLAANTTIATYTNATTVLLSAAATGSGTGSITIGSPTVTSATASFTSADVGMQVVATNVPANTFIASVTNATTAVLNAGATGAGTAITATFGPGNNANYTTWAGTTLVAPATQTQVRKGTTGSWAAGSTIRQMRFTTYK